MTQAQERTEAIIFKYPGEDYGSVVGYFREGGVSLLCQDMIFLPSGVEDTSKTFLL